MKLPQDTPIIEDETLPTIEAAIRFKSKPRTMTDCLGETFDYVTVPNTLKKSHLNLPALRKARKLGAYANSDFIASIMLGKACSIATRYYHSKGEDYIYRLDRLPETVTVDASGFLASVSIAVIDSLRA